MSYFDNVYFCRQFDILVFHRSSPSLDEKRLNSIQSKRILEKVFSSAICSKVEKERSFSAFYQVQHSGGIQTRKE